MRLLLRCDAGPSTGVGHAVRCAAIAEAADSAAHEVFWSGRLDGLEWLWAGLAARSAADAPGAPRPPGTVLPPADSADDLVTLCTEHRIDVVHVDHYRLGPELRDALNPHGVVLSSMEDFHSGRRAADVVVDPNLGAERHPRPDDGSPLLLRGPRYAPLRESVRRARTQREGRGPVGPPARTGAVTATTRPAHDPPRVLVVMGGTDAAGLLPGTVRALAATGVPAAVDVVRPPGRTLDAAWSGPVRFRTVDPLPDLPGAAADVDLVVSAAGTTVWELCCVGVPMALVRAADNQLEGYQAVTEAGAAAGLGTAADLSGPDAVDTLRELLSDAALRDGLAARAHDVVDGRGAERVLDAVRRAAGADRALSTRPATAADAEMLLAWRNDPETRRWSRTPSPVTPVEHRAWLERSLGSGDRMLLVVEDADGPVGTVRWDRDHRGWEVSITVAPERRGSGFAGPVLTAGERALRASAGAGTPVAAVVHRDNAASARLFARAGYRAAGAPDADGFGTHRRTL